MTQTTLPIHEIQVLDRQRQDLGDIDSLADSLTRYGLIQPIIITQDRRLIAGGRRLAAAQKLQWRDIPVVFRETLTTDELHELELEENVRRKEMSWQEKTITIAKIHKLKKARSIQDGTNWGQRESGEMLGVSVGKINYCLIIAQKLANKESPYWKCDDFKSAWNLRMREEEDEILASLAKRQQQSTLPTNNEITTQEASIVENAQANPDLLASEREKYYSNPLNPPDSFETYWAGRCANVTDYNRTIYISTRFVLGDSIKYMMESPGLFDHILTDIPYGIDVAMMDQDFGKLQNIDTVAEEHDVEYNYQLIADFFPAAFHCTNDKAFVVTWCDQMLWQYMYDHATKAGFKVQRWPYVWLKPTAANTCSAYNQTKATEIAMICRKPGATLVHQVPRNYGPVCTSAEAKALTGHPYAKPFELTEDLANQISIEGQKILDPFCGRGSIVLKLLAMKRSAFGVELKVEHYNALIENVKQYYLKLNPEFIFK